MATYQLTLNDQQHELEVEEHDGQFRVRLADVWYPIELERVGESARYSVLLDRRPYNIFAEESPHGYHIVIGSRMFAITTRGAARGRRAGGPADMETTTDTGEWVGGPIVKNKLFFFESFESQNDNRPLTTFLSNPGGAQVIGNTTRVLGSDLTALSSFSKRSLP